MRKWELTKSKTAAVCCDMEIACMGLLQVLELLYCLAWICVLKQDKPGRVITLCVHTQEGLINQSVCASACPIILASLT